MSVTAHLLHDALPADAIVSRFFLDEGLSRLFDCFVEVGTRDANVDVAPMLWSTAAVQVFDERFEPTDPGHCRFVHGAIEEAGYLGMLAGDIHVYRFRIRPAIHGLAYRVRSRIFQGMAIIDVVTQVFEEAGIDMQSVLFDVDEGRTHEYVTQWKESELDFVLRWLEELGVHFWFEHSEVDHTMYVSDKGATHKTIEGNTSLRVVARVEASSLDQSGLFDVRYATRRCFDRWSARDWNFLTPDAPRDAEAGEGGLDQYEYPGFYPDDTEGKKLSSVRAEAQITMQNKLTGRTRCRRLAAGRTYTVADAHPAGLIGDYLVTDAVHRYSRSLGYEADGAGAFETEFTSIPAEIVFRPPRVTPRPKVAGKESAVVTGPAGEEIYIDEHGRIKVHFYWDREQPLDETASCWIRTQQQNTAGAMFFPRIGWEVDIGFLNGDPDRPIMLQKLYNEEEKPPYDLPASLMQSSLRSSSSPGGGGTNEVRLNDADGAQEFFTHAQRDFIQTVGNDNSETVAVDSSAQVAANAVHNVGGAESISVGGNQSLSVTGGIVMQCAASQTVTVGGLDDWGVSALHTVTTHGSRTDDVGGLLNVVAAEGIAETFNADHSLTVGAALSFNSAGPLAEAVAGDKTELVGGAKLEVIKGSKAEKIDGGKVLNAGAVKITTGEDVTLSAGAALAINIGGDFSTKCGEDFGISGTIVTLKLDSLKMTAGAKVDVASGKISFEASSLGGDGAKMLLKGTVKYK